MLSHCQIYFKLMKRSLWALRPLPLLLNELPGKAGKSTFDTVYHTFTEASHFCSHILQTLVHVPEDTLWLPGDPILLHFSEILW